MLKQRLRLKYLVRCFVGALVLAVLGPALAAADAEQAWNDYRNGRYAAALSVLNEHAETGDSAARFYLGTLYADGLAVQRDYRKALELYLAAAKQGHPEARFTAGFMLVNGAGAGEQAVASDPVAGAYWLRLAAEDGDAAAHVLLSRLLSQGRGVDRNLSAALEHALAGAKAGNASAQFDAGWLLVDSDGTAALLDAYMYFTLAERSGYPGAKENRISVGNVLTESEREQATAAADAWKPAN